MKLPAISPIELARNAPLSVDLQTKQLEGLRYAPASYDPFRIHLKGIFNPATPLFGLQPGASWPTIEANLCKACRYSSARRSDAALSMNLPVAKSLYDYVQREQITAREVFFGAMQMGSAARQVRYWLDMILNVGGRATVVFVDPRKAATKLSWKGRKFVFSMMHEHIRGRLPDLARVQLAIIQFADNPRQPLLYTDTGIVLFSYAELQNMVDQTYRLWETIVRRQKKVA